MFRSNAVNGNRRPWQVPNPPANNRAHPWSGAEPYPAAKRRKNRTQPRSGARMQPTAPAVGNHATTDQPWRGDRHWPRTVSNFSAAIMYSFMRIYL